ncbi:ABC transporter, putative [Bodo saltans]|uniref:ABC transporter, putative n=1 Tax=Bodo saltans TaxID=75058 RepID=A0A0S4JGQ8_BODSA|nr:ABC transporter, putative [Bodo saltans]|eukprot:CUG89322.1 ABC transporter, putative [Bodo saltans]
MHRSTPLVIIPMRSQTASASSIEWVVSRTHRSRCRRLRGWSATMHDERTHPFRWTARQGTRCEPQCTSRWQQQACASCHRCRRRLDCCQLPQGLPCGWCFRCTASAHVHCRHHKDEFSSTAASAPLRSRSPITCLLDGTHRGAQLGRRRRPCCRRSHRLFSMTLHGRRGS